MTRIVIRPARWPYLVWACIAAGLAVLFSGHLFVLDDASGDGSDVAPVAVSLVFGALGLFLAAHWVWRFARDEPTFTLDDEGFTYAPDGVSTGLIRWHEVESVRDVEVVVGAGGLGPTKELALAVVLRDPAAYVARFPAPLRPLFRARESLSGTPLLLDLRDFGPRLQEVRQAMEDRLARARQRLI